MKKMYYLVALLAVTLPLQLTAQTVLTLEECRDRAVQASKELDQARVAIEMAGYDRKIARANYLPNISATGAYLYNNRDIALINDTQSELLRNAGTLVQDQINTAASGAIGGITR